MNFATSDINEYLAWSDLIDFDDKNIQTLVRNHFAEIDYPTIYPQPNHRVVEALNNSSNFEELIDNILSGVKKFKRSPMYRLRIYHKQNRKKGHLVDRKEPTSNSVTDE